MLRLDHITVEFSSGVLYDDISFLVNDADKVGLVGRNGAGKTTMLRLIAGEIQPTSGTIVKDKGLKIGYLPQVLLLDSERSLQDEVMTVAPQRTQENFTADDAQFVALMSRVLLGLGFTNADFERPCSEFSGGWRMRIELAKILLTKPDLLLLDEPTNFLDIESIEWLEGFLQKSKCAILLVCHDKEFLNNVTNRTVEITLGRIYDYDVPYSQYLTLRAERHEQQVRAYNNQQKKIADTEAFIERFRYKATKSVQVQSRIKMLNKLERLEVDLEDTSHLNLRFPPAPRSGDFPLIIDDLAVGYPTKPDVLMDVNITLKRGDKVAFVGKNGEGKSTLVKCIMNQLEYTGMLKIGHNVSIGYFAQNQASLLDENLTVFDTIDRVAVGEASKKVRDILGAFMFGGEASDKYVKVLSGGERTRLAMIKLLLEPCNLLILDEPTNHLDIPSKEVLKKAIADFTGTVICVSHDRDFLDGIVSKIYEFGSGRVREYLGGIHDFLKHKNIKSFAELEKKPTTSATSTKPSNEAAKNDYQQQKAQQAQERKRKKQIEQLEQEIATLENEQKALEQKLATTENQTPENLQKYSHIQHEIEKKMYEWEILNQ